jgi:hypothetical protein
MHPKLMTIIVTVLMAATNQAQVRAQQQKENQQCSTVATRDTYQSVSFQLLSTMVFVVRTYIVLS